MLKKFFLILSLATILISCSGSKDSADADRNEGPAQPDDEITCDTSSGGDDTSSVASTCCSNGTDDDGDGLYDCDDDDCDGTSACSSGATTGSTTGGTTTDADADGYTSDTDCDDTDATINPGESETCNGVDDDCSGTIDDGLTTNTYYADADDDTYGDPDTSSTSCSQPSGYVSDDSDCDDTSAAINSTATEIMADGTDQDCDGYDYDPTATIRWVSSQATNDSSTTCTLTLPCKTIEHAISIASASGGDIAVLSGSYSPVGSLTLPNGVSLYGSFDSTGAIVNHGDHSTIISFDTGESLVVSGLTSEVNISGITIDGNYATTSAHPIVYIANSSTVNLDSVYVGTTGVRSTQAKALAIETTSSASSDMTVTITNSQFDTMSLGSTTTRLINVPVSVSNASIKALTVNVSDTNITAGDQSTNSISFNYSAGLYVVNSSTGALTLNLTDNDITTGNATGGSIGYAYGVTALNQSSGAMDVTLTGNTIDNIATDYSSTDANFIYGIYISNTSSSASTTYRIANNEINSSRSGIEIHHPTSGSIKNNRIAVSPTDNTAPSIKGIYILGFSSSDPAVISNNLISIDAAVINYAINIYGFGAEITNNSILQGEASTTGYNVHFTAGSSSTLSLDNNLFYNDDSTTSFYNLYLATSTSTNITSIKNNDFYFVDSPTTTISYRDSSHTSTYIYDVATYYTSGIVSTTTNIHSDPLMTIDSDGIYSLSSSSPLIDTGSDTSETEDVYGSDRTVDGPDSDTTVETDIGAIEYQ